MTLPKIQQHNGYSVVALHQLQPLAEALGLELSQPANQVLLRSVMAELIATTSVPASGLVLHPEIGLPEIIHKQSEAGILLPLQIQTTEMDPLSVPNLDPQWGVEQIANNYALAYLELFYHPAEPQALLKKQMLAELMDYCQYVSIELVVRLRVYSPHGEVLETEVYETARIQAVQELQRMCHLLVLDSPETVLFAATLTAELDIPWLVWLEAPQYEQVKETLRMSVESGAKGFMIGSALWPELSTLRRRDVGADESAIQEYVRTTVRDRVIELSRIVGEEVV